MIKVNKIDHVAIALPDVDEGARKLLTLFGLLPGVRERVAGSPDPAAAPTEVAFLHGARDTAGTAIELVAPAAGAAPASDPLARFVGKRGTALHHVCFEVDDLASALADLKAAAVPLIDETPRPGARGHWVAFIHPKATGGVLFELCQRANLPQGEVRP